MIRTTFLSAVALAGCSQEPVAEPQPVTELPAVLISPQPVAKVAPQPPAPTQPPAPAAFAFTSDMTGQALPRVVAPVIPVKLPNERLGGEPKPRAVPAKYLDPEATVRTSYVLPAILPAKPVATQPATPPEKVPLSLGAGASDVPAKPVLPVAPVVTERARDVNLPPAAPSLGRQTSDRVPYDDPTSEPGNATITAGAVKVPLATSGFLKVTVPDPFELGEQVKPSVPPAVEPGAAPVVVNPQRVK